MILNTFLDKRFFASATDAAYVRESEELNILERLLLNRSAINCWSCGLLSTIRMLWNLSIYNDFFVVAYIYESANHLQDKNMWYNIDYKIF